MVSGHAVPGTKDYQDRRPGLRLLATSLSHGPEWKTLISRYIGTIPVKRDASSIDEQCMSADPPRTLVSSAMIAKVGAAAKDNSQSAAPKAAASAPGAQADPLPAAGILFELSRRRSI
ncbi:hypothetical protein GGE07_002338 [Sinorhizobium terangae]|uniref:Uncharacterized protein n=1 Tax=Sinorhizobium terangae TaxID=110322 RepID=A0A6N7LI69_SINTE|nr:hypothetical protein [Sinorhizobium terangae]MBB4185697.1 hypothetical protein [Sinorhizobium terangae]MQX17563.1 hypothetical protein [Sinorhizobium terangae]